MSAANSISPVANRVPDVTLNFWLIKLMAVTMGETAADYLAVNLGFGLTVTSLIMTAVLIRALVLQFRQKRYVPWSYWLAVVLICDIDGFRARRRQLRRERQAARSAHEPPPALHRQ